MVYDRPLSRPSPYIDDSIAHFQVTSPVLPYPDGKVVQQQGIKKNTQFVFGDIDIDFGVRTLF